jgi:TonB family protein
VTRPRRFAGIPRRAASAARKRPSLLAAIPVVLGLAWGGCSSSRPVTYARPEVTAQVPFRATALDSLPIDSAPWAYYEEKPCYPQAAQTARIAGTVFVSVLVDELGLPERVTFLGGDEALRSCVEKAAWNWRFAPARRDSIPVAVELVIPFDFRLR